MCGRYYVDDDTAKEIEKIVRDIDEQLKKEAANESMEPVHDRMPLILEKEEILR